MKGTKKSDGFYMLMSFGGNAIFGFSFLFSKLAMKTAEPFVLLAVRFVAAFLILTAIARLKLVPCELKGKNIRPLIVLGLLEPVMYFIFETYGLACTPTSFAGIVIALIPIAGLTLGVLFLKERPSFWQIVFSVLSVAGVIVATATDDTGTFQWKGFLLLLGAVFSAGLFSVQNRRISHEYSAFERTYVMFGVSSVCFVLLAALRVGTEWSLWLTPLSDGGFWVSIIYLAGLSSVGAFMMINKAQEGLPVARSLVFSNITTVITVLAGVFILKEQFSLVQALGILMVLVGVYGVNRKAGSPENEA